MKSEDLMRLIYRKCAVLGDVETLAAAGAVESKEFPVTVGEETEVADVETVAAAGAVESKEFQVTGDGGWQVAAAVES